MSLILHLSCHTIHPIISISSIIFRFLSLRIKFADLDKCKFFWTAIGILHNIQILMKIFSRLWSSIIVKSLKCRLIRYWCCSFNLKIRHLKLSNKRNRFHAFGDWFRKPHFLSRTCYNNNIWSDYQKGLVNFHRACTKQIEILCLEWD